MLQRLFSFPAILILAFAVLALLSKPVYAQVGARRSGVSSLQTSTPSAGNGFYFSAGAKVLIGKIGTEDGTTLESRNMSLLGAETVLGYQWSSVIFGAGAEYNFWQQQTKAADVGDTNLAGSQTQIAAVLGYRWSPFVLIGKYYLSSEYKMSKASSTGEKATYSQPAATYGAQLLYHWSGQSHVGIEYTVAQYEKQTLGGTESTLSDGAKLNTSAVGVVYVWIY